MSLTEDDIRAIADEIDRRREKYVVPPQKHLSDHEFIDRVRENEPEWREVIHWVSQQREARRDARTSRQKIWNTVIGGLTVAGIVALLGFIGAAVWSYTAKMIARVVGGH